MSSLNTPSNSTSSIHSLLKALVLSTTLWLWTSLITSCENSDDPEPDFEQTTDTLPHDVLNYTLEDIETYLQNHSQDQLKNEILQAFKDSVNNSNLPKPIKHQILTEFIRDAPSVDYAGNHTNNWIPWIDTWQKYLSARCTAYRDPFPASNQVLDSLWFSRDCDNFVNVDTVNNTYSKINVESLKCLRDILIFDQTFDKNSLFDVLYDFSEFMKIDRIQAILKQVVKDWVLIYLTNDDLYSNSNGRDIAWYYNPNRKSITIKAYRISRSSLHEIGHYIDDRLWRPSESEEFKNLQIKYYDQLRDYITIDQGEPWNLKWCRETFADCVNAYLQNYKKAFKSKKGKLEKNSELFKERCPEIADFIEKKLQEYLWKPLPKDTNYKYVDLPDDE